MIIYYNILTLTKSLCLMTQRLYLHNREHLPKSLVIDYLTEFPDIEGVINQ